MGTTRAQQTYNLPQFNMFMKRDKSRVWLGSARHLHTLQQPLIPRCHYVLCWRQCVHCSQQVCTKYVYLFIYLRSIGGMENNNSIWAKSDIIIVYR